MSAPTLPKELESSLQTPVRSERDLPDKVKKPTRRVHVSLPGLLDWAAGLRAEEHGYDAVGKYLLELVAFDVRGHREHVVTRPYADDPQSVQDAIARAAIRHHVPGGPRRGLLVTMILGEVPNPPLGLTPPRGALSAAARWIVFPRDLWEETASLRWSELTYPSFSQYVAALVLYDVLLSGRHRYFNGGDNDSVILASLDAETIGQYKKHVPARLTIDQMLETAAGRPLSPAETQARMLEVSAAIREYALKSRIGTAAGAHSSHFTD